MTTLVLGGSGQLGRTILAALAPDRDLIALRRKRPLPALDGVRVVGGDLDTGAIDLGGASPDTCVSATELFRLPAIVPDLARQGVRRLIGFSSTSVHVKLNSPSRYERDRVTRVHDAETVLATACDEAGIAWTILRPTMIYGGGPNRNVTRAARTILKWKAYPVAPPASGLRQPVHAHDLADAVTACLASAATLGRTFDLGGGERVEYREMIGRIFDAVGVRRRIVPIRGLATAVDLAGRLTRHPEVNGEMVRRMNRDLTANDRPAREAFGWSPRSFLAGGRADLHLEDG